MKLSAYDEMGLFNVLESEWNDLLKRSTSDRIFSTWEWQSAWWDAYQAGKLWVITCRDDSDRLLGIAPWFIETTPTRGRVVRSIGCVEVTDYLDLIVDRDHEEEVLNCFAHFIREHHAEFDVIDLCNLPKVSVGYRLFSTILAANGFEVKLAEQEVCPVITLPSSWDEYLDSLDKKQRHEIRRKMRRAENAPENISWYIVDNRHNLDEQIKQFLSLMAASHSEKARFLQDEQNVRFFKSIAPLLYRCGWLQMSFLKVGEKAVAAYLNFIYNNQVLVYNSGLLPDQYGHLSPGIVLLAFNIRHAIEHDCAIFDFLRGNEIYKYRMGGQDTSVYMLVARYVTE